MQVVKNISSTTTVKFMSPGAAWTTVRFSAGIPGAKGDAGEGVPSGGGAGDILVKESSADFDTHWTSISQLLSSLPEYDSNESAILGGLIIGDWYIAATGHNAAPEGVLIRVS